MNKIHLEFINAPIYNSAYQDGIKCWGECHFPHKKENYDLIIQKINEYNKKRGVNT